MNNNKIKRIGVDARFYGPGGKGLGRYAQEVLDRILLLDDKNEYVIFLSNDNFEDFKTSNPNVKKVLAKARWYSIYEQVLMPYLIWKEKLDFIHFMHFNVPFFCPAKFIVTIHDLILTRFPSRRASTLAPVFYYIKNSGYRMIIKRAVYRSEKIIAVSNFTKLDILNFFHVSDKNILADKIQVIYEGIAESFKRSDLKDDKEAILRYNIHIPYLLYVGNVYPHKNLEVLIKIFPEIKEKHKHLQLVLVGKDDYFYERLKKAVDIKNSNDIIFPGFVPDDDLRILYGNAIAYVFPSLYEGFGLPPLEAMANGCPVISSNKSSMPEILGDAALYFDPNDREDIKKKIEDMIGNEQLRSELKRKGSELIKKYSWDECASQIFDIYDKI